ncbi:hypothetical protein FA10DRAFT_283581 [Acaromyces ingoldii]|uniref:Small ribosomal subunit protein mS33 n=1 Tax=Acaromyces ingoldii TaxID=215250 RepID=A0A316YXJ2_9BASI|nr:hypothetical protein FA10DRAFT_283581 [Acaromyces ingoldii]PWN93969.1 hypothetical protein FA10DRAFT_283581 [Acaromyces ingoldii]
MSRPASPSLLYSLRQAQARIFNTNPPGPPSNPALRTGSKVLKKRLVGPSMLQYYPPSLNLRSVLRIAPNALRPEDVDPVTRLIDPREVQRLKDVERKKMLGKGPPKKGEGRRAAMKGGKRK